MSNASISQTHPEAPAALRFAMKLAPRAQAQLEEFPENLRQLVRERLEQLALRGPSVPAPAVRGHLMGTAFHAVYEVDNERETVTVMELGPR